MKYWMTGLASVALAFATQAQETPAQPDQQDRDGWLMTSISFDDLEYIVETEDYDVGQVFPDDIAVMAMSPSGIPFFMQGTACSVDQDCQGLHIWMSFTGEMSVADANQLNYDYAAVSVMAFDNGSYQISRYLILDHGTTMANIKANLLNALAIGEQIWAAERATEAPATVSDLELDQSIAGSDARALVPDLSENALDTSTPESGEPVMRLK